MQAAETPLPECNLCGLPIQDDNAKGENIHKSCATKRTVLHRMFTVWPPKMWADLPKEHQMDIFRTASSNRKKLQDALCNEVATYREEQELERTGGKYLPLSVYAKQGYNPEKIKNNCKSKLCPQLEEETYLLNVDEEIKDKIRRDVKHEVITLQDESIRGRLSHYASPSKKDNKRKRSGSSKSSKSSSSSSSQLTAAQKKKLAAQKAKEEAAEKAQQAKKERLEAAQKAQQLKAAANAKSKYDKATAAAAAKAEALQQKEAKKAEAAAAKQDIACRVIICNMQCVIILRGGHRA